MKRDCVKNIILGAFIVATVILLCGSASGKLTGFWNVNISNGIEIFILIFVSYYLVERQNEKDRKREKIEGVIAKIQGRILDSELIQIDSEENKKATRIKITSISNLLEIVKKDLQDMKNIDLIISDMDTLSGLVMDHIDDVEYIKKSNPQILRLIISIDTKLEEIKFEIN